MAIEIEEMIETTPEGRAIEGADQALPMIEDNAAFVEEGVAATTPEGKWSGKRLNAAANIINKFAGLVGAEIAVEPNFEDTKGPMPAELVRGLLGISSALDAYVVSYPEEAAGIELYDVPSLVSDRDLAMATATIETIISSKEFQRWMREDEPVVSVEEEPVIPEEEIIVEGPPAEADVEEELDILSML